MRVQRLPRCGEHARHTGTGDGLPWTLAKAVAGVANFFPPIFSMGSVSTPKAAPTARIFANRACAAPHMAWSTRASPQNGRQAATGGGRGGGRHRRCQKKIASTITGIKSDRTHPPSRKNKNRAIRAPPTMYSVEASRRNWWKTATDGDRGRGGRRPWLACFFVVGVYRMIRS